MVGFPSSLTIFSFFLWGNECIFFNARHGNVGVRLPMSEEELLDAEFIDNMTLYLHGQDDNLSTFHLDLERFCDASIDKINWHKPCGFGFG